MGCETICKFCEHADPSRERNGLIRCLKKHIFVAQNSTCPIHSFHYTMDSSKIKELMQVFGKEA